MDSLWAEAHTLHFDAADYMHSVKTSWMERMTKSPHGSLLKDNSFFRSVKNNDKKIYLLHVTQDVDKIISSSTLYPSAGCLVGCVYTTQLYENSDGTYSMHNLGKYILEEEAPRSGKVSTPLVIEVSFPNDDSPMLSGINYLKLGKIHHAIYEELRYLLSQDERKQLEDVVAHKIKKSLDFISLCSAIEDGRSHIDSREFIEIINRNVANLSILGYMYFEALAEYTMLHSEDVYSAELKSQGEFNNTIYKGFLANIYDKYGSFKLSDFSISVDELEREIDTKNQNGTAKIDIDDFFDYIKSRVSHMVVSLLLTEPSTTPNWLEVSWDYKGFSKTLYPLVGHMIHRELRNFNRYKDFYFYFDQFKALSAWNYWNKMNIALPFNGPLQKGEIGINPANQKAKYRIHIAKYDSDKEVLSLSKELSSVEIAPRLIDLRHTVMRSKDHVKMKGGDNYVRSRV